MNINKYSIIIFVIVAPFFITACGGGGSGSNGNGGVVISDGPSSISTESKAVTREEAKESLSLTDAQLDALMGQGFQLAVKEPAMKDMSINELNQALQNKEPLTDSTGAPYEHMPVTYSSEVPEMVDPGSQTAAFTDEPWDERTVVDADMTENMTPEEKAEFDEFMNTDWEAQSNEIINNISGITEGFGGNMNDSGIMYGDDVPENYQPSTDSGSTGSGTGTNQGSGSIDIDEIINQMGGLPEGMTREQLEAMLSGALGNNTTLP
ncbi:MAG: hypothetical protein IJD28_08275 [Deferribacterales bacterium]|nr:hypothetical protein [Deferribacterales bacterium]